MLIYLASYPRSGNSWSQALVKHYFQLPTYSVYVADTRKALLTQFGDGLPAAAYVENATFLIPALRQRIAAANDIFVIKTHELPFAQFFTGEKIIHIVRHPGAALWSYLHYLREVEGAKANLEGIIQGQYGFGSWCAHTKQWLLVDQTLGTNYTRYSYEQMHESEAAIATHLASFLGRPLLEPLGSLPDFEYYHQHRPNLARRGSPDEWQLHFTPAQHSLLDQIHGTTMQELGYTMPITFMTAAATADTRGKSAVTMPGQAAAPRPRMLVQRPWLPRLWHRINLRVRNLRWQGQQLAARIRRGGSAVDKNAPVILHITHYKAGSQWVAEILKHCVAPDSVVLPQAASAHFKPEHLRPGALFPTVYLPRNKVEAVTANFAGPIRRCVVIRDLRDTLVSLYFSVRYSHSEATLNPKARAALLPLDLEEGMLTLLTKNLSTGKQMRPPLATGSADCTVPAAPLNTLSYIAQLQRSWMAAPDRLLLRYEELVADEHRAFQTMIDYCQLPISPKRLRYLVADNSFAAMTGRQPGQEDIMAHARKGIVGDWRTYFTDSIKTEFKARYGQHLIDTGYEKDVAW